SYCEGTALAWPARYRDGAADVPDEAIGDGEAQAQAAAGLLGGIKRVEKAGQFGGLDARAGIGDGDLDGLERLFDPDGQHPDSAVLHGVGGIGDEVDQHLLEVDGIAGDREATAVAAIFDIHAEGLELVID